MAYVPPAPFSPSPDAGMGAPISPKAPGLTPPPGLMPRPMTPNVNGIPGAFGSPTPPPLAPPMDPALEDPASQQYWNETQADGSIIIGLTGPDGARGPILQVIRPKKNKPGIR